MDVTLDGSDSTKALIGIKNLTTLKITSNCSGKDERNCDKTKNKFKIPKLTV